MSERACAVEGCTKAPRSGRAELCPMHYHRQYRHGDVNRVATTSGVSTAKPRRYRRVYAPGHPLASSGGRAWAHRVALFDRIGPGEHLCHWCGTTVAWVPRGTPGCLFVDHVNGVGDDNRAENLVPSCAGCNTARGLAERRTVLLSLGFWSGSDTVGAMSPRRGELIG